MKQQFTIYLAAGFFPETILIIQFEGSLFIGGFRSSRGIEIARFQHITCVPGEQEALMRLFSCKPGNKQLSEDYPVRFRIALLFLHCNTSSQKLNGKIKSISVVTDGKVMICLNKQSTI